MTSTSASIGGGRAVRSASGDIRIGRLDGPTIITLGSGDIELRQVGPGSVNVRAISGDVEVRRPRGPRCVAGRLLDERRRPQRPWTPRHTDVDPALPQLELTLSTVSGDIDDRSRRGVGALTARAPPRSLLPALLIGQTLSAFGDYAMFLALAVWVKALTGSNAKAGLAILPFVLPSLVGPALGVFVDRFPRRRIMIVTDLVAAVALCCRSWPSTTPATSG